MENEPTDSEATDEQPTTAESFAEAAAAQEQNASPEDHAAQLQAELDAAADRELRALAELENLRKRVARDLEESRKFASLPLVRDLLPAIDNLQRALASPEEAAEAAPIKAGVQLVLTEMMSVLANHHCRAIPTVGEVFDPNVHEALGQQPSTEHEAGQVMMELRRGFEIHGRVVRPAQVFVSTGAPE